MSVLADRFVVSGRGRGKQLSEFAAFDLDRTTARAWTKFQARLADHLAEMGDEDTLVVDAEVGECADDGAAPYVQFAGFGDGTMVRGEVASNEYLAQGHRLSPEQCSQMEALGWAPPTVSAGEPTGSGSANYFADLPVGEADRLAVMSVKALRDVLGVAHPAFLSADPLGPEPETAHLVPPPGISDVSGEDTGEDEAVATMPESEEHLRALVDDALRPLFGSEPEKDDDGDIPVPYGSSLVFVRVERDAPVVQVFSVVAEGVTDRERAQFEVNVLNRDLRFMKFILVEDRVLAQVHLPAWPFVPEHLRSMLTGMSQRIDELDEDLVARVGGRRAFEPSDDAEEAVTADVDAVSLPREGDGTDPVLATLIQLDADGTGRVDPELAAGLCGHDRSLIVALLRQTEEQEIAWRTSRDQAMLEGDTDEAAACDHELHAWEHTTRLLRRTLRLVVERALHREPGGTASYTPDEEASTHAPRMRRSFPPRPAHRCNVRDADDLLRMYGVADLVELDEKLSRSSAFAVEVFDTDDGIEVQVDDYTSELEYPFTLADLHDVLNVLESTALADVEDE